jgi:hypothetical protein
MNGTHRPRQIGRSIGAVLAGAIAGVAVTLGTTRCCKQPVFFRRRASPCATYFSSLRLPIAQSTASRAAISRPGSHLIVPRCTYSCLAPLAAHSVIVGVVVTWGQAVAVRHE